MLAATGTLATDWERLVVAEAPAAALLGRVPHARTAAQSVAAVVQGAEAWYSAAAGRARGLVLTPAAVCAVLTIGWT